MTPEDRRAAIEDLKKRYGADNTSITDSAKVRIFSDLGLLMHDGLIASATATDRLTKALTETSSDLQAASIQSAKTTEQLNTYTKRLAGATIVLAVATVVLAIASALQTYYQANQKPATIVVPIVQVGQNREDGHPFFRIVPRYQRRKGANDFPRPDRSCRPEPRRGLIRGVSRPER